MKSGKYHKMDMHSLLMQITAIWSWLGLAVKVPREELVEHALTNDLLCFVFPLPQWLWTTECSAERTSTRRPSTTCFTTWEPPALWPPSSVSTLPACPFLGFVAAVALQLIESKALQHTSAQLSCTFGGWGVWSCSFKKTVFNMWCARVFNWTYNCHWHLYWGAWLFIYMSLWQKVVI